jgi:hypothetical protein
MVRTAAALILGTVLLANANPVMAADTASETPLTTAAISAVSPALAAPPVVQVPRRAPQTDRSLLLPSLYVSLSALQAYDVYTTLTGIRNGAVEANPMMQGVVGNPGAFIALKAGVTGASIYMAERLWKDKTRTQAVLLMVASNGLMAYVAHHNTSVLRSLK